MRLTLWYHVSSSRRANPGTTVHLAVSLQLSQEFSAVLPCLQVLAAYHGDARYAFAQRVMASSLLTPCAPWPVGISRRCAKQEGGARTQAATRIWHECHAKVFFSERCTRLFSGQNESVGGLPHRRIRALKQRRQHEISGDPSNCFYRALRSSHGTAVKTRGVPAHFLRIPTNMCVCPMFVQLMHLMFRQAFLRCPACDPPGEGRTRERTTSSWNSEEKTRTNVPPHSGSVVVSEIFNLN